MSTPMIRTFRHRWATYLRIEGWRDRALERLMRLTGNNRRSQATSARVEPVTVRLVRNELVQLQESNGLHMITVREGIVWLTGTPACGDVILHCGSRFEFGDQWPFLLQAMEDSKIELSAGKPLHHL